MNRRQLNPNKTSKRVEISSLKRALIENVTPSKEARRRAERERRSRLRRQHRLTAPTPRTGSTTSTRPFTPSSGPSSSGGSAPNAAIPNQSPMLRAHCTRTGHVELPTEPDNETQEPCNINHNTPAVPVSLAVTPRDVASHFNSRIADSTSAIESTDMIVSEGHLFLQPRPAISNAGPPILPAFEDLVFGSSREYWNTFRPEDMNLAELGRHLGETAREVQRRAPPPGAGPDADTFPVRLTFEDGQISQDEVYLDYGLEHNFVSYAYLWRLRTTFGRLPRVVPAPPVHREILTPDGVLAPIKYFLFAELEWEDPDIPFPRVPLRFTLYRGNGAEYDTKIVLGRSWFDTVEEQATSYT